MASFVGLNLLDILHSVRDNDDDELQMQCDIFLDEKQEDDDAFYENHPQGIDLSSHGDVFNTIFKKVRRNTVDRQFNGYSFGPSRQLPSSTL